MTFCKVSEDGHVDHERRGTGVLVEILKGTLMRYQDSVLWV